VYMLSLYKHRDDKSQDMSPYRDDKSYDMSCPSLYRKEGRQQNVQKGRVVPVQEGGSKEGRGRHVQKGLVVPAQEGGSGMTYIERTCRPCTCRPCTRRTSLGGPKELIPGDSEKVLILSLRCTWYIRIGTGRQVSGILLQIGRTSAEKCAIDAFLGGSSS